MKNIYRAFKMLPSWRSRMASIVVVTILRALIIVAVPLAIARIIDILSESIGDQDVAIRTLLIPFSIWVGLRLALGVVQWWGEVVADDAFRAVAISFRQKIVSRLESLPVSYFEKRRSGQIASEINQSPFGFGEWIGSLVEDFGPLLLRSIFALAILAYSFLPIAIVILVISTIYALVVMQTMKQNRVFWKANRKIINEHVGVQVENIQFASDVRALGVGKQRGNLYRTILGTHDSNLFKMFRFQHRRNFYAELIDICLYVIPIGIFAYRAINGQQNPSDIFVLAVYLDTISTTSSKLARIWSRTIEVNDTIGETLAIVDQDNKIHDPAKPQSLKQISNIQMDNVTYTYDGHENQALKDVSFAVSSGQTIALVGRSGSGKSTIIKLLLRFYDPSNGKVLVNNTDLKSYAQDRIRAKIGVVMQDVALFNDTVAGNIGITKPSATREDIETAAKMAYIHDFITSLPKGYDTIVGERGVKLSGGEKQRISIARAILRNPELVLLDEATSALDSESEKAVQAGLKELLKDRTAIIIAHRLSTITHADKILVLDKGQIVQTGTYKELKAADGLFAELLKHQEL